MRAALIPLLVLAACGTEEINRPLPLEIDGLSARAQVLVLKVFEADTGQTCRGVTLDTVAALAAEHEQTWERTSMAPRSLEVPALTTESMTIVAYALDAAGAPMQFLCTEIDFAGISELPEGVLIVTLSQRMT